MQSSDGYWFAPIVARPIPEFPDRVTVGIVFGNGRLERIEIDENLDRLRGIVSAHHRELLQQSLRDAAAIVTRFRSLDELGQELGVQFEVGTPRRLLQPFGATAVRSISKAYFAPLESVRVRDTGLLLESLLRLDHQMTRIVPPGIEYHRKRIAISDLYPGVAARYSTEAIGPLRRVALGQGRHLILSSVIVRASDKSHIDGLVQRTIRQAYFLNKLRVAIRERQEVEFRFVGVLQPLDASSTGESRDLRAFYEEQWAPPVLHTVIATATRDAATEALEAQVRWVSGKD